MKKILIVLLPVLLMTGCVSVCVTESKYEYIDLFGNKGNSDDCYSYVEQGGLYCEIGENTLIQVAQYTLIEEKEVCNE